MSPTFYSAMRRSSRSHEKVHRFMSRLSQLSLARGGRAFGLKALNARVEPARLCVTGAQFW